MSKPKDVRTEWEARRGSARKVLEAMGLELKQDGTWFRFSIMRGQYMIQGPFTLTLSEVETWIDERQQMTA